MNREKTLGIALIVIGVLLVVARLFISGMVGQVHVAKTEKTFVQIEQPGGEPKWVGDKTDEARTGTRTSAAPISWATYAKASKRDYDLAMQADPQQTDISLSMQRTIGTWFAAFLTLALFSFLYRDNPLYKLAESIFIGVSAAYWMVVQFWSVLVPNLLGKLIPTVVSGWAMPGLESTHTEWIYLVPLLLGIMLLWRLMPAGAWIARWPLALFIGVFAGLRMVQFIEADFINQIGNSILPLVVKNDKGAFDFGDTIWNIISVVGVLCCLTYFFFSIEHKGAVGSVARVGTWILMITFGAMFGYTVMGRITLLTGRFEFLFDDWLWLIDPSGLHSAATGLLAAL